MTQQRSSSSSFTDVSSNLQYLSRLGHWLLDGIDFSSTRLRSDCRWSAKTLVLAALIWAWSDPATLGDRFELARKIICKLFSRRQVRSSYQAFIKLLGRHTGTILPAIVARLRRRMQEDLADNFLIGGRAVFAVDGTRSSS